MVSLMPVEDALRRGLSHFGLRCDGDCLDALARYVTELDRWNRKMNLVGVAGPEAVAEGLILDSFFVLTRIGNTRALLDAGSGSGLLSVPAAVLGSAARVFSVERNLKRVHFQRHVKRLLGLERLSVLHSPVEAVEPLSVDALFARAFGPVGAILEKGGRHVAEGGRAFLPRGEGEAPAEDLSGFSLLESIPYRLPGHARGSVLLVYGKRKG